MCGRCIACNIALDVVSKEGWDDGYCRTCKRASYDGYVFAHTGEAADVVLVGFEPAGSLTDPLGGEVIEAMGGNMPDNYEG